jgi:tRNA threonylcarbamoyladenosine dehydratase
MPTFLEKVTSSTSVHFAATALVSGAVVATTILGYQNFRRSERVHRLKGSIPSIEDEGDALRQVGCIQSSHTLRWW